MEHTWDSPLDQPWTPINVPQDDNWGVLQELVDATFKNNEVVARFDLLNQAQIRDVDADIMEVVELMPPGRYTRAQLADQMNSILTAHGWGQRYGTVW